MSGLEPFEVANPTIEQTRIDLAHGEAVSRMGWGILALNNGRYRIAEMHLARATKALQELQRITGGR